MDALGIPALIALIAIAVIFDALNGLHDAANSIATIVSTRVLRPQYAVAWAAFFNFIAFLFFGLTVAQTVGTGIVSADVVDAVVIFGALMGAISWNLLDMVARNPVEQFPCPDRRAGRGRPLALARRSAPRWCGILSALRTWEPPWPFPVKAFRNSGPPLAAATVTLPRIEGMSRSCGPVWRVALGLESWRWRPREIEDAARLLGTEPTPATSVAGLRAAPTQTLGELVRASKKIDPLSTASL